jgi:hypothetical protein
MAPSEGRPGAVSGLIWDDGESTSVSHNDMAQVSRAPARAPAPIGQEAQPAAVGRTRKAVEAVSFP